MRATVDEERRPSQAITERRVRVVDGEFGYGQLPVPVVLPPVGEGAESITNDLL